MTDLSNPDEFAKAFKAIDDAETIRNSVDADEPEHRPAKYPYRIIGGQMVRAEGEPCKKTAEN